MPVVAPRLPATKKAESPKKVQFADDGNDQDDDDGKIPGEDNDIDWYGEEEEMVPVQAGKKFLFGAGENEEDEIPVKAGKKFLFGNTDY